MAEKKFEIPSCRGTKRGGNAAVRYSVDFLLFRDKQPCVSSSAVKYGLGKLTSWPSIKMGYGDTLSHVRSAAVAEWSKTHEKKPHFSRDFLILSLSLRHALGSSRTPLANF